MMSSGRKLVAMSIIWLALAAFAIGTEAFVIVGLLPVMAADLDVALAATGQLVTAYAITYAIGSPILAVVFNNVDRRAVVSLALVCFVVGNIRAVRRERFDLDRALADPFFQSLQPPFGRGINLGNALEAPREGEWGVTLEDADCLGCRGRHRHPGTSRRRCILCDCWDDRGDSAGRPHWNMDW